MEFLAIFFGYLVPALTLFVVLYDKVRSRFLTATLNGKKFLVPKDEVKEAFRRSALAEASRQAGGRRVELDARWERYRLVLTAAEVRKTS